MKFLQFHSKARLLSEDNSLGLSRESGRILSNFWPMYIVIEKEGTTKLMIIFLTGVSSVGKTTLCRALAEKKLRVIEIDTYFDDVRRDVVARWKEQGRYDWDRFEQELRQIFLDRLVARLNRTRPGKIVIVDDILSNIYEYIHRVRIPHRVVLVSVSLRRLYKNLLKRKNRPGGRVLDHLLEYYRPVASDGVLSVHLRDLRLFQTYLKRIGQSRTNMSIGLRSAVARIRERFFKDGERETVILEPVVHVDENLVLSDTNQKSTVRKLYKYIMETTVHNDK